MIGRVRERQGETGRYRAGADPGFLKRGGGVHLRSTSKKGGPGGGPIVGPMLKSLHRGPKSGTTPPPPIRPCRESERHIEIETSRNRETETYRDNYTEIERDRER